MPLQAPTQFSFSIIVHTNRSIRFTVCNYMLSVPSECMSREYRNNSIKDYKDDRNENKKNRPSILLNLNSVVFIKKRFNSRMNDMSESYRQETYTNSIQTNTYSIVEIGDTRIDNFTNNNSNREEKLLKNSSALFRGNGKKEML